MNAGNYLPGLLESAARLLESAPSKGASPQGLPRLGSLGFVYLHVGAPERVFEYYEGTIGLVDLWRARGWPDVCRPAGAGDFVCE